MSGNDSKTIPCLKKGLLKSADSKEVQKKKYKGARKPMMPDMATAKTATERYTIFHKITHTPKTSEYSRFNTRLARMTGQVQYDTLVCRYTHLINLKPAEHSSLLAILSEGIKKLKKLLVDIKWI